MSDLDERRVGGTAKAAVMSVSLAHPLDRPIWTALTTRHAHFGDGGALARRYTRDIGPLSAARDASPEALAALAALAEPGEEIALVEIAPPAPPSQVEETLRKPLMQMSAPSFRRAGAECAITQLGEADAQDMLELAQLTRPGPFRINTHRLGRFVGVRDNGRLIAMAGERMAADGFIEISAVCTHPDWRGRGFGAALMSAVGERIVREGATPFLHVYNDNTGAIALYEKLSFVPRAQLTHVIWKRRETT